MASLLDTIRGSLGQQPNVSPQLGTQQQISDVLRTKSGKDVGPGAGPGMSSISEQMAAQQTRLGGQQLQQSGDLKARQQAEQSADITQREDVQTGKFEQRQKKQVTDYDNQVSRMLDGFNSGMKTLDNKKDISSMEQAGVLIRLGNEQYVTKLKQEGQKARLDTELGYKEQLSKDVFGQMEDLFRNNLQDRSIMDLDNREFAEMMSQMDVNAALDIANSQARQANAQAMSQGIGNIVSAGTSYMAKRPTSPAADPEPAGSNPITQTNVPPVDKPQMSKVGGQTQSPKYWDGGERYGK